MASGVAAKEAVAALQAGAELMRLVSTSIYLFVYFTATLSPPVRRGDGNCCRVLNRSASVFRAPFLHELLVTISERFVPSGV